MLLVRVSTSKGSIVLLHASINQIISINCRDTSVMCNEQMRKVHERRRALRKANEAAERVRLEAEWKAKLEKQKAHEKVNHPVRAQI